MHTLQIRLNLIALFSVILGVGFTFYTPTNTLAIMALYFAGLFILVPAEMRPPLRTYVKMLPLHIVMCLPVLGWAYLHPFSLGVMALGSGVFGLLSANSREYRQTIEYLHTLDKQ